MSRRRSAAFVFCAITAALAVFQLALALGAPFGAFAWGGQVDVLPTSLRVSSLIAIGLYAVFAVFVLDRAGVIAVLPGRRTARIGTWILVAYLILGTAMNVLSQSAPERLTMTPVSLLLAILAAVVALA